MSVIIYSRVGENKGTRRIWMEGFHLRHGGVTPDTTLYIRKHPKSNIFQLHPKPGSDALGTIRVSRRTMKDGREKPLIEIKDATILDSLPGQMKLRIGVFKGKITIRAHVDEQRIKDREKAFLETLMKGEPLQLGSLFHGGGMLDLALHRGLDRVGIPSYTKLAVEWEPRYISSSYANNPQFFHDDSIIINGPIQDSILPEDLMLHILTGGVPCVGASKSGISKNGLTHPEEHSQAGSMFYYFLRYIEAMNPALVVLENVVEYASSASMAIIRSVLDQWGYTLRETVLNGNELGAFENRDRLAMIATSKGLDSMNLFPSVRSIAKKPETLADVVEDVAENDPVWRDYDYLRTKAVRDKAAGKGFAMQELDLTATKVGTIGRGYAKVRSTEPRVLHPQAATLRSLLTIEQRTLPHNPKDKAAKKPAMKPAKKHAHSPILTGWNLLRFGADTQLLADALSTVSALNPEDTKKSRLLSLVEHCRVKGAPESIITGNSGTIGHEILGQGVIVSAFEAVFVELGIEMLTQIGHSVSTMAANDYWYDADIIYLTPEQQDQPQASAIDLDRYPNVVQFADDSIALIAGLDTVERIAA
ncbi:DNA cytosine methyltransferase [Marinobacter shengliensis]|uniref:DNA cytosine methyltransferase n=1 Tax=Marinobacter shengliensis TaxID=1389223 RepID=UPI00110973AF|nr:DNA cytosine methyltransferase [Marinobacter shengliensis]